MGEPSNRRSRAITAGMERAPNRAMLRAVGFGDDDFAADRSSFDLPHAGASYEEGIEYHRQLVERLRRENPGVPAPEA